MALPFPENITRKSINIAASSGIGIRTFSKVGSFSMVPDVSNGFIGRKSTRKDSSYSTEPKGVPHEYLLPDTRDGPLTLCFPYVLTRERVRPSWGDFFPPAPGADGRDRQRGEAPS